MIRSCASSLRPHRFAGRDLRIQIERALVGAEPLMQHGQVRDRHLAQARAGPLGGPPVDVRDRLLVQSERLGIAAAPVMHVADVVQAGDFAVAVATGAIQLQRPLIAGERVVVAPEIQVGEADRVEVPGRVRSLTECLMNDERLLRLLNRRLVLAQREGGVGHGRERARQRRSIVRRAQVRQERREVRPALRGFGPRRWRRMASSSGVRRQGRADPVVIRTRTTSGGNDSPARSHVGRSITLSSDE